MSGEGKKNFRMSGYPQFKERLKKVDAILQNLDLLSATKQDPLPHLDNQL